MKKVITISALLRYLEKKKGYEKIKREFINAVSARRNFLFSSYDYFMFYSEVLEKYGGRAACGAKKAVKSLPIEMIKLDGATAEKAAEFREKGKADSICFALALAGGREENILR